MNTDFTDQHLSPIAILGAGSWGTTLALYLSRRGQRVRLWGINPDSIKAILSSRINQRYLPNHILPDNIELTSHLYTAVEDIEDILIAIPSHGYKKLLEQLKPLISLSTRLLSATKGMDRQNNQLLHEIVYAILHPKQPFAILSGPSFAHEIADGLPAALVIASHHSTHINHWMARFNSPLFRIALSTDLIGVEISGITKNVIAIATGIIDGRSLGSNARSALITQGLSEIMTLGISMGAQSQTFMGLAGIGDLMLTCTDNHSRNRRFGLALGQGYSLQQAEERIGQVIEGKQNAQSILALANQFHIHMPICQTVYELLSGKIHLQETIQQFFPLFVPASS